MPHYPPFGAGNAWTWTAIDADTKLIVSYFVGCRDADTPRFFMDDLKFRIDGRMQLTTDGHGAYLDAVASTFRGEEIVADPHRPTIRSFLRTAPS